MTSQRWEQIKAILADALEREDSAERAVFVARACAGDAELEREVNLFLVQKAEHLETYANGRENSPSDAGKRVGAYELVHELGRGGMGAVWLARRVDRRFEQQVAIKLLKRGTDTEEVLRRFQAERQILARLDHPGIARLFDGGETSDGLPFFVMEFVAGGARLTNFANERKLSLAARLRLFCKVCAAVQFAHQNLVVHRDLKPGNILVTPDAEPKLLDFGIARLLYADDDAFEITAPDHRRLTLAYASPEQVRGEPVTTATDLYSLGALLYELLTGESPHRFSSARPSSTELARVICEEDPRRPSLVAKDAETRRHLRGDLDNVVLRAMAREPARRYASAAALADDLARHLAGRTVRARPDTFAYRANKFIRRNKVAVTAGALLVMTLLAGLTATLIEAHRAQRRFDDVHRLTNSYLFEIDDAIHDLPGATAARKLIVSRALEYLDRLAAEAAGDRALQLELAGAYLKVGDVQGKPYSANLGEAAGALRSYAKAVEIAAPLAASEHGRAVNARRILSKAYESLGTLDSRQSRWEDAIRYHRQALALREELLASDPPHKEEWQRGIVADEIGLGDAAISAHRFQPDAQAQRAALEDFRRALPPSEELAAAHPGNVQDRFLLAKVCSRIASVQADIGAALHDASSYTGASDFHARTIALDETLLRAQPESSAMQRNLADELIALAYLRAFTGEHLDDSLGDCARAEKIMAHLAAADPANAEARQDLSSVHFVTGRIHQAQGDRDQAAESYHRCLEILEPLVAAHPGNVETAFDLARVRRRLDEVTPPGQN
ncbi:MAG TPA: serine/threonine-protein kinase [Chthoniobacterales bacterium]